MNSYIPYVVEPSLGADRVALAFLCDAYDEEEVDGEEGYPCVLCTFIRRWRRLKPAVLPLSKKLNEKR